MSLTISINSFDPADLAYPLDIKILDLFAFPFYTAAYE